MWLFGISFDHIIHSICADLPPHTFSSSATTPCHVLIRVKSSCMCVKDLQTVAERKTKTKPKFHLGRFLWKGWKISSHAHRILVHVKDLFPDSRCALKSYLNGSLPCKILLWISSGEWNNTSQNFCKRGQPQRVKPIFGKFLTLEFSFHFLFLPGFSNSLVERFTLQ